MQTSKKPREFWIREDKRKAYDVQQMAFPDEGIINGQIHVIEKSAFDKAVEALKYYAGNFDGKEGTRWNGDMFFYQDKFGMTESLNEDKAREVLKELGCE